MFCHFFWQCLINEYLTTYIVQLFVIPAISSLGAGGSVYIKLLRIIIDEFLSVKGLSILFGNLSQFISSQKYFISIFFLLESIAYNMFI